MVSPVHAILGVRPPRKEVGQGTDSQDHMDRMRSLPGKA